MAGRRLLHHVHAPHLAPKQPNIPCQALPRSVSERYSLCAVQRELLSRPVRNSRIDGLWSCGVCSYAHAAVQRTVRAILGYAAHIHGSTRRGT